MLKKSGSKWGLSLAKSTALNVRSVAAQLITAVIRDHQSLSALMEPAKLKVPSNERALLQELVYGTLRWQHKYAGLTRRLLKKQPKNKDHDLLSLIWLGLYQLEFMRIPEHAAVDETVKTCQKLRLGWAKGVLNGVLRNFIRQQDTIVSELSEAERCSVPDWLYEHVTQQWGKELASQVFNGWQAYPPFTLRVNLEEGITARDYAKKLSIDTIQTSFFENVPSALTLTPAIDVNDLPGFSCGTVSVQDGAAQLAAPLLVDGIKGRERPRILDACAAPGGKTAHLLQMVDAEVVALDVDPLRLKAVSQNLQRINKSAKLVAAEAQNLDSWWDGNGFDAILLDAPCSGTGVIRRHPDIKHLRRPEDIAKLAALQAELLAKLWITLKPGGQLLYVTCSLMQQENEQQIRQFVTTHKDASLEALQVPYAQVREPGWQILPGQSNLDGFYFARLRKADV